MCKIKKNISLIRTIETYFSIPENKSQRFYINKNGKLISYTNESESFNIECISDFISTIDVNADELASQALLNRIYNEIKTIKTNLTEKYVLDNIDGFKQNNRPEKQDG